MTHSIKELGILLWLLMTATCEYSTSIYNLATIICCLK